LPTIPARTLPLRLSNRCLWGEQMTNVINCHRGA
jgi:hypothetical protein